MRSRLKGDGTKKTLSPSGGGASKWWDFAGGAGGNHLEARPGGPLPKWRLPRVSGDPERIALWAQVVTGTDLDEHGEPVALGAAAWQARRQRLQKLGGPLAE